MKKTILWRRPGQAVLPVTGVLLSIAMAALPGGLPAAYAQENNQSAPVDKRISLELKDVPIRQGLEQLFKAWGVDYVIEQGVSGFVNLRLTDQSPENVLKLMLRVNTIPLTYVREGGVYIIRVRTAPTQTTSPPPTLTVTDTATGAPSGTVLDVIPLVYTDPLDLSGLLGVIEVPFGSRISSGISSGIGGGVGNGLNGVGNRGNLGRPGGDGGNLGGTNGVGRRDSAGNVAPLNPAGFLLLGTQDNRIIVVKP